MQLQVTALYGHCTDAASFVTASCDLILHSTTLHVHVQYRELHYTIIQDVHVQYRELYSTLLHCMCMCNTENYTTL